MTPAATAPEDGTLRRAARRFRPLRSLWNLFVAMRMAVADSPARNRRQVDDEFAVADPWDYAGSLREQDCFHHQVEVLDRARAGGQFGKVWEVGCAEGYFTERLAERSESVLAVDLSEVALDRARRRMDWGDHVRFEQFDLRTGEPPGKFDLIVIAGVLEYLPRPAALRAARRKLVGALDAQGRIFLVTTRSPVAETAWWGRFLRRGARINEYIAEHPQLKTIATARADWYVIDLLERR